MVVCVYSNLIYDFAAVSSSLSVFPSDIKDNCPSVPSLCFIIPLCLLILSGFSNSCTWISLKKSFGWQKMSCVCNYSLWLIWFLLWNSKDKIFQWKINEAIPQWKWRSHVSELLKMMFPPRRDYNFEGEKSCPRRKSWSEICWDRVPDTACKSWSILLPNRCDCTNLAMSSHYWSYCHFALLSQSVKWGGIFS